MTGSRAELRRVAPGSIDGLVTAMRDAFTRGDALTFTGGGTHAGHGYPVERIDATISTERLTRVVDYAPDDMTVTVEAGVTLAALQDLLRAHGQRLAFDAPLPERATLGGLIATNDYGPRRARYGTLRDVILGASFVRADGVLARGGGRVVKNVAGFDLPKLLVGSLGTLGCIASATFRLHPIPEAERTIVMRCASAAEVRAVCEMLVAAQLEPAAVVALAAAGGFDVGVTFEGFGAGVDQQASACAAGARALNMMADTTDSAGAIKFWARHARARTEGDVRVKFAFAPADLSAAYHDAVTLFERAVGFGTVAFYPTVGVAFCSGSPTDIDRIAPALLDARAVAERLGGGMTLLDAPADLRDRVDIWGMLPPSFELMQRIKHRFDPLRRCNPGRFIGHI